MNPSSVRRVPTRIACVCVCLCTRWCICVRFAVVRRARFVIAPHPTPLALIAMGSFRLALPASRCAGTVAFFG
uniref:Putative secreted peptide n=1 Tax=Anopheles braziliensis TaxID=58242 RepID=A0A2M3ZXH0_9DIPT